jgi:TRAP-type mannitol/chloroaromatic compound transport system permease small subunit
VTFIVVILRYLFNTGWIAMQESITYMHALVFMIGAAYTLKREGHVRIDIFYRNMSARKQAWVNLLGTLLLLIPMFVFMIWVSWDYVMNSWHNLEGSPEAGGIPAVFLLKTIILVMPVLMLLQGAGIIMRSLSVLLQKDEDQLPFLTSRQKEPGNK